MADALDYVAKLIWFFLPVGFANMMPMLVFRVPILGRPLDFGATVNGKPILGPHKTWRGLIFGTLSGGALFFFQQQIAFGSPALNDWALFDYAAVPMATGFLMGFGALLGDAIRSFFKRRVGIPPGGTWVPFDQIDYLIGGVALTALVIHITWSMVGIGLLLGFLLHLVVNYIGFLILPWKKTKI